MRNVVPPVVRPNLSTRFKAGFVIVIDYNHHLISIWGKYLAIVERETRIIRLWEFDSLYESIRFRLIIPMRKVKAFRMIVVI